MAGIRRRNVVLAALPVHQKPGVVARAPYGRATLGPRSDVPWGKPIQKRSFRFQIRKEIPDDR